MILVIRMFPFKETILLNNIAGDGYPCESPFSDSFSQKHRLHLIFALMADSAAYCIYAVSCIDTAFYASHHWQQRCTIGLCLR
jgi:hypothetical protein